MADYKLSHTAAEIDEKLSKVQEGGTGYTDGETIHPIDQKFLPGVCLPMVELATTVEIGAEFTEEESAKLTEAYNSKLPIAIRCNVQTDSLTFENCGVIAMSATTQGLSVIAWDLSGISVQIVLISGKWMGYSVE